MSVMLNSKISMTTEMNYEMFKMSTHSCSANILPVA